MIQWRYASYEARKAIWMFKSYVMRVKLDPLPEFRPGNENVEKS